MTARRPVGVSLLALGLLALGSAVPSASADVPTSSVTLATSATHAISLSNASPPGCADGSADGGSQVLLSDDRGATWAAGPCDPRIVGEMHIDPSTGLLAYSTATSIVWLTASGSIVADVAISETGGEVVAANRNYAYLGTARGDIRVSRDGSTYQCGLPPASDYVPEIAGFADGTIVSWSSRTQRDLAVSQDDCGTFTPVQPAVECSRDPAVPIGPEALYCDTKWTMTYFNVINGQLVPTFYPDLWVSADPRLVGVDGSHVEALDALSTATVPATWPARLPYRAEAPPGDPFPSPAIAAAIGSINSTLRGPTGLPPISWSGLAAQAATNHAIEWQLAGVLPAPMQDFETPGAPGFTGADDQIRCATIGLGQCQEFPAPGVADATTAITDLLTDPAFVLTLLSTRQIGVGSSAAGSVVVEPQAGQGTILPDFSRPGVQVDLSLPVNTPSSVLRVWPADGATNISSTWTRPAFMADDPLELYGGPFPVGPPILAIGDDPATYQLLDPHGLPVHLIQAGMSFPTTSVTTSTTMIAYPTLALTPGATYTIDIRPAIGPHQDLRFTVAGGTQLTATPNTKACSVSLHQARTTLGVRLTINAHNGTCAGDRVQWRRRAPLPWRGLPAAGTVAPAGRVLYWRVLHGKQVVLHGRVRLRRRSP